MGSVDIVGTVQVGNRTYKLKKSPIFFKKMGELFIEATTIQLRILAYGTKDYIIDKLLAQRPPEGELRVFRTPGPYMDPPVEPKIQQVKEPDIIMRRRIFIPPRDSAPATEQRVPFKVEKTSRKWLKKKIKQGKDPRTLIASGDYVRGIVVRKRVDKRGKSGITYVVTMANRKHRFCDIRLQTLALIQEFGTSAFTVPLFGDYNRLVKVKLPQRPHWRPAHRVLVQKVKLIGKEANAQATKKAVQQLA